MEQLDNIIVVLEAISEGTDALRDSMRDTAKNLRQLASRLEAQHEQEEPKEGDLDFQDITWEINERADDLESVLSAFEDENEVQELEKT